MARGKTETVSKPVPMLAPVAALTRFRPDTRSLNRLATERTTYIRQGVAAGAMKLLLPYQEKVEIIQFDSACPIPNTPMWFIGMVNNRGNLLSVFDLKLLTGMEADVPAKWLMILGQGGKAAGVCIDTLPVAIENPLHVATGEVDVQTGTPDALRPHFAGAYSHNGVLWMDINYESLFIDLCSRF